MYLVQMLKFKTDDGDYYLSPKLERLQAFEYQLLSKKWSVIDCIPEKGAGFEVHFGGKNSEVWSDDGLEYTVAAVCVAADTLLALKTVGLMQLWLQNDTLQEDDINEHILEQDGILLMYVEDAVDSDTLFTKIL